MQLAVQGLTHACFSLNERRITYSHYYKPTNHCWTITTECARAYNNFALLPCRNSRIRTMIENPINQAVTYHCALEPPAARDSWDIIGGPGHHLAVIYHYWFVA